MYSGKSLLPVAILLAFGTFTVSARDCPKACTLEFNQVCATNGKEYRLFDNPCMMDVFNCEHEFLWTRTRSLAPCLADISANSADIDDCIRPCTMEYNPICAFDGGNYRFFDNLCEMHNAECGTDKHYEVANLYNCVPHPAAYRHCEKPCTFEYSPVCGFNGVEHKTFDNICIMNNEHCKDNKAWKQTRMDECTSEPVPFISNVNCEKPCTFEYMPVCGFNGYSHEVFPNQCTMENAHCKDGKKWAPTPFTECIEFASVEDQKTHNCEKPCNRMYKPVCGTDGQQYKIFSNQCEMENQHCADHHEWKVASFALCEAPQERKKDCIKICPRIYAPVCGTDGQSYQIFDNQCLLEKEQECDGHEWKAITFSLCENPIPLAIAPQEKKGCFKPCNRMYKPVCGTDGQQYKVFSNQCIMENEHCNDNHEWKAISFNLCENPIPLAVSSQKKKDCVKPCNKMYAPVCGTDGQQYKVFTNQCIMENEHCNDNHEWKAISFNLCENSIPLAIAPQEKKDCVKPCNRMYAPVCGTDGQQYKVFSNQCIMENEHCYDNHEWKSITFSLCENPIPLAIAPQEKKDCVKPCNRMYAPVCGTDGQQYKVFSNQCIMENEHCYDNHEWKTITFSLCENPIPLAVSPQTKKDCPTICPLNYLPICAFNGKTHHIFSNDCELKAFNCQNEDHFVATFMDECKVEPEPYYNNEETYACPDIYDPQCGFDGLNYNVFANECEMNAYNRLHKSTQYSHVDLSFCQILM